MPTFLSDPPFSVYLLLAVGFIVAGAMWVQQRSRESLAAVVLAGVLVGLLLTLDVLVESPREEAGRRVRAMCDAVTARDREAFVSHLSERFEYRGATRAAIRQSRLWEVVERFDARAMAWGFDRSDYVPRSDTEFEIAFYCKGQARREVQGQLFRFVRATFVRDPDGQHRLRTLKFYSIEGGQRHEDPPPGFP